MDFLSSTGGIAAAVGAVIVLVALFLVFFIVRRVRNRKITLSNQHRSNVAPVAESATKGSTSNGNVSGAAPPPALPYWHVSPYSVTIDDRPAGLPPPTTRVDFDDDPQESLQGRDTEQPNFHSRSTRPVAGSGAPIVSRFEARRLQAAARRAQMQQWLQSRADVEGVEALREDVPALSQPRFQFLNVDPAPPSASVEASPPRSHVLRSPSHRRTTSLRNVPTAGSDSDVDVALPGQASRRAVISQTRLTRNSSRQLNAVGVNAPNSDSQRFGSLRRTPSLLQRAGHVSLAGSSVAAASAPRP